MDIDSRAPRSLSELHLWLAADENLITQMSTLCAVDVLRPEDWRERMRGRAAFLLVETSGAWERAQGELDDLLASCERAGVPALLWITVSPLSSCWLDRCGHFERVFSVDFKHLPELEAAGARDPGVMWPATAFPFERPESEEVARTTTVLWLGGWSEEWPAPWRERLADVLRGAAQRGLRIVGEANLMNLPPDLTQFVDGQAPSQGWDEVLRRARVVIGADPLNGALHVAPRVVFDAAAAGAAVITPHKFRSMRDFAVGWTIDDPWLNLVPVVNDVDTTVERIDDLLGDSTFYDEIVDHFRRVVAHNHTYAHRLATLASAAGLRILPHAQSPASA